MDTPELLRKDPEALGALLERERARLRRMVQIRIDRRLRKRVDVSDVIQEVHLDAARRIGDYVDGPAMPFYLWLRLLASQKLVDLCRHHLGAEKRDVRREVALAPFVEATSVALAEQLAGSLSTPSRAADRAEVEARVRAALEELEPIDREVLALRHFEQLGNDEAAQALGIDPSAASKRYVRALKRLGEVLST
jgi:RNA polymerase sigma-70 factor (ECF subfamily)